MAQLALLTRGVDGGNSGALRGFKSEKMTCSCVFVFTSNSCKINDMSKFVELEASETNSVLMNSSVLFFPF